MADGRGATQEEESGADAERRASAQGDSCRWDEEDLAEDHDHAGDEGGHEEEAGQREPLFDLDAAQEDQATVGSLDRGGKILRALGLGQCFSRAVKLPGDDINNISLQVPLTKRFIAKQRKEHCQPRKTNLTTTAKYSIWTFVPLASAYQFRRLPNLFYLFIAIIALAGFYGNNLWIVSFNPATIIALLVVVVGVALVFEGIDDFNRHRGDAKTNNSTVERIRDRGIEETTWGELLPGDFVIVNSRESVPADIVLLCSYGADKKGATCYIETSGIDGETNLKIKEVPMFMSEALTKNANVKRCMHESRQGSAFLQRERSRMNVVEARKEMMAKFIPGVASGMYEYEQPNVFMQFNGSFTPHNNKNQKQPVEFRNLILRGSHLRNTKWIIGVVVYAGPETKLALSNKKAPAKLGQIDHFLNKVLVGVFVLYLIITAAADVLLFTAVEDTNKWWYFKYTSSTNDFNVPGPIAFAFTYLILFANIIPIPIIIAIEVLNFYAQAMLNWDINLYHAETDTRAKCQTSSLVAEIGQITHIFSDKTGTLTRNQMKMVGCFVNSKMYGFVPPVVDATTGDIAQTDSTAASEGGADSVQDYPSRTGESDVDDTTTASQPSFSTQGEESRQAKTKLSFGQSGTASSCSLDPSDPRKDCAQGTTVGAASPCPSADSLDCCSTEIERTESDVTITESDYDDDSTSEVKRPATADGSQVEIKVVYEQDPALHSVGPVSSDAHPQSEPAGPVAVPLGQEGEGEPLGTKSDPGVRRDSSESVPDWVGLGVGSQSKDELTKWDLECGCSKADRHDDNGCQNSSNSEASMKSINIEDAFEDVIALLHDDSGKAESEEREALHLYFLLLSICHTVVLDYDADGQANFNAESPDEEAFVKTAALVGYELVATGDGMVTIKTPQDSERKYKVLGLNPFNSSRKRMSLVVQCLKDDKIYVMLKGADNKVMKRLASGQENHIKELKGALEQYSWNGLRTLVMGMRELEEDEFLEWEREYKDALVAPSSERSKAIAKAAEKVERDLRLLGASAIEDQLQLGVPEAIKSCRDAGIQVWVLTGDKIETAINIGLSSNLLDSNMMQLKLLSDERDELNAQMDEILHILDAAFEGRGFEEVEHHADELDRKDSSCPAASELETLHEEVERFAEGGGGQTPQDKGAWSYLRHGLGKIRSRLCSSQKTQAVQANVALIISGDSLELLLAKQKGSKELEAKLLRIARVCKVVLACRVSPAQKSLIVEMVRYAPDGAAAGRRRPITLAIGDGANDVPMIQSAHVGVGISGHEGRQAVNSADFAIAQFRFLVRMLLVHGRWNYRRQAKVINFIIYTWLLYTFLLCAYLPFSLFSGQQIYYFTSYTAVFAYFVNVTICAHGWFDRDISAEISLRNPWTYQRGVIGQDLNYRELCTLTIRAVAHLMLIYGFIFSVSPVGISIEVLGTAVYVGIILVVQTRTLLEGTTFTSVTVLVFLVDFLAFLLFMSTVTEPAYIYTKLMGPTIWTGVILALASVTIVEMIVRYVTKEFFPHPLDLLIEQDRGYYKGEKHARAAAQDAIRVMEEVGRLTVLPLTLGGRQITRFVERQETERAASRQRRSSSARHLPTLPHMFSSPIEAETGAAASKPNTLRQRFSATGLAFQRMRPAFDFDMPSVGNGLQRIGNNFNNFQRTWSSSRRLSRAMSHEAEEHHGLHNDQDLYSSTTRLDLQQYVPTVRPAPIVEGEEPSSSCDDERRGSISAQEDESASGAERGGITRGGSSPS